MLTGGNRQAAAACRCSGGVGDKHHFPPIVPVSFGLGAIGWTSNRCNQHLMTWPPNACLPQINGSLARAAIRELLGKGLIKEVAKSRAQSIYTRATKEA